MGPPADTPSRVETDSDILAGVIGLAVLAALAVPVALTMSTGPAPAADDAGWPAPDRPVRVEHASRGLPSRPVQPAPAVPRGDDRQTFAARLRHGFGLGAMDATEFAGWILDASARQNLEAELLASLVMVESSFRRDARSAVGAIGPAQVRPHMWVDVCGGDLNDPEENVHCGALVLRHYWDLCSQEAATATSVEACALGAYNVGFGNLDSAEHAGAIARYLAKIRHFRESLRRS